MKPGLDDWPIIPLNPMAPDFKFQNPSDFRSRTVGSRSRRYQSIQGSKLPIIRITRQIEKSWT